MTKPVVVRKVEQPPADAVAALERYGVSTVHEAQERRDLLASYMRPIYAGAAVAGPAGGDLRDTGRSGGGGRRHHRRRCPVTDRY